jgi:arylsulfatase A-like enzyme
MITRLDASVGRIMDALRARRIDQDTVVFFTSDNGPHSEGGVHANFLHSSGALRGIKRDLYEGGIRVPLIVRWPGHIKPGTTSDRPLAFWDVLPTLADLLQTNLPAKTDGLSFSAVLQGKETAATHDHFYWEFHEHGYQRALRSGEWKAIDLGDGKPFELYHLADDPGEKRECSAEHPEIVARLKELMRTSADPFTQPEEKSPFKRR